MTSKKVANMKVTSAVLLLILVMFAAMTSQGLSQIYPLEVTVATDKTVYRYREMVTMYGNVTYEGQLVQNGLVGIQVRDPADEIIVLRTVPSGAIPSASWIVEVMSVVPCDSSGNPTSTFRRKAYAYFDLAIANHGITDREALIVLNIFDVDHTPIGLFYDIVPLAPNNTVVFRVPIWLYDWVSTGSALACVNAYTDWPQDYGYPYCPEKTASFSITSTSYASLAEITVNNSGNYNGTFRIPPEVQPYSNVRGTYFVAVAAFRGGWKAFHNTTFTVEYQYPEDIDFNHEIDIYDVVKVTSAYGTTGGQTGWNPKADVAPNGIIEIYDVVKVTSIYGLTY